MTQVPNGLFDLNASYYSLLNMFLFNLFMCLLEINLDTVYDLKCSVTALKPINIFAGKT